jgi:integrase
MHTPKLCRHKATSQGYVTLNGREHYLGIWSRDQKKPPLAVRIAYDELMGRWLAGGRKLPDPTADGPQVRSVNAVIEAFLNYATGHYKPKRGGPTSSEVESIKQMCGVVAEAFGRVPVTEFGPLALKDVRARMIARDWSRTYTNHQVNRLKRMFRWAAAEEMIPATVVHGLSAVGAIRRGSPGVRETEPVKPVPDEWIAAALPFMSRQVAALVRLQVLTGARPGEAVLMRACDIDRTGRVWVFTPESHKTEHHGKGREVYIGPKAQELLGPWLEGRAADAYLFSPHEAEAERRAGQRAARKSKVQPSQRNRKKADPQKKVGACYTTDSYRRAIEYACKVADRTARDAAGEAEQKVYVPKWSPHRLRHNAATALRREFGIELAQLALGHSTLTTTLIYAERDREKVMGAFAEVG